MPQLGQQRRDRWLVQPSHPPGQVVDLHRAGVGDVDARIFDERAASLSRVPPHSGQVAKVTARSTKARMCGCMASTSLDRKDCWMRGISPIVGDVEVVDLHLDRRASRGRSSSSCAV
jgi:hypothetical protein